MDVFATGHWEGDATDYCGELNVFARTQEDSKRLAVLYRVLADADSRERLLDLAERVEQETLAGAEVAPGCRA